MSILSLRYPSDLLHASVGFGASTSSSDSMLVSIFVSSPEKLSIGISMVGASNIVELKLRTESLINFVALARGQTPLLSLSGIASFL